MIKCRVRNLKTKEIVAIEKCIDNGWFHSVNKIDFGNKVEIALWRPGTYPHPGIREIISSIHDKQEDKE